MLTIGASGHEMECSFVMVVIKLASNGRWASIFVQVRL